VTHLDEAGRLFGRPALVITQLRGRGTLVPLDGPGWLQQFAATLASIHAVPVADSPLEQLENSDARRTAWLAGNTLWQRGRLTGVVDRDWSIATSGNSSGRGERSVTGGSGYPAGKRSGQRT
jgi:hypothetical protein